MLPPGGEAWAVAADPARRAHRLITTGSCPQRVMESPLSGKAHARDPLAFVGSLRGLLKG
jgi:hypothetical protein